MNGPEAIRKLIAQYARAIDVKDFAAIAACFWPDALFTYEHQPLHGRDQIVGLMRDALEPLEGTQHLFMNFIIDLDGDTARVTFDGLAQHWRPGIPGGTTFMAGGKYEVRARCENGVWKIAAAAAGAVWSAGNPALFNHAV